MCNCAGVKKQSASYKAIIPPKTDNTVQELLRQQQSQNAANQQAILNQGNPNRSRNKIYR